MSGTVTFDGAPPAGTIDLGIGEATQDRLDDLAQADKLGFLII